MSAIRLARGFTGRSKIVKFEGCYHGHADSMLVKAGSGLLTFGNPTSSGVPEDFAKHTMVLDYNNIAQLEDAFQSMGDTIACVIVEPVAGNMNLIRATPEFLQRMRELSYLNRGLSISIVDERPAEPKRYDFSSAGGALVTTMRSLPQSINKASVGSFGFFRSLNANSYDTGRGTLLTRGTRDWSPPAFYAMGSGSVGFQIGAKVSEVLFIIRTEKGLQAVLDALEPPVQFVRQCK